ncbi:signal peptidase I [Enterococcus faecalis]|nr:signal peptidase I [Enterococcus faecalis]EJE4049236.1 signal peptidase I [Enterococcus faecalis]
MSQYTYIFSYSFDLLIENELVSQKKATIYTDRQSFLRSDTGQREGPIVYKLYGTSEHVEQLVLTTKEKKERMINTKFALTKCLSAEELSFTFIGFKENDEELANVLDELSKRESTAPITFIGLEHFGEEEKTLFQVAGNYPLNITCVTTPFKEYLDEQKSPPLKWTKKDEEKPTYTTELSLEGSRKKRRVAQKERVTKRKLSIKIPYKTLATVGIVLTVVIGLQFFVSIASVEGESMAPNYRSSDYLLLNKQCKKVHRFDVVAFQSPDEAGQEYIKRVIGLPGDEIEYIDDQLYINGHEIKETYLDREKSKLKKGEIFTKDFTLEEMVGVKEVPKNKLFVLGDNRLYSRDSRNFGFIDVQDVKGNVAFKLWPLVKETAR